MSVTQARAFMGGLCFLALTAPSCMLVDEHILTVRNETARPIDGLVVGIKGKQVSVPRLNPGASTTVRMRINAESHWEIYLTKGQAQQLAGVCGYTGTTTGRPTVETLRLVSKPVDATRDCVVGVRS